ncbi:MAG: triose-phosphate isomerase [Flavobacteriaceae bacterium]
MKRRKIVAGNWKMNKTVKESKALAQELVDAIAKTNLVNTDVVIAPTSINLDACSTVVADSMLELAAQNMHQAESGAYTGEISASMISAFDINYVILGHSERREYFGETNASLAEKVSTALKHELTSIFCIGEVLEERKEGKHFEVVSQQIKEGLFHIENLDWKNIVLAYEPVWAIGTGETASPEQAQEIHAHIRSVIAEKYGQNIADEVSILYGGSVKPANAEEIFSKADVDGGLIGGAALNKDDFMAIVKAI